MTPFKVLTIASLLFGFVSCGEQQDDSDKENAITDTIKVADTTSAPAIADTINAPRLVNASADGSLLLTAETGKGVGPNIKYMPEWRAFGWFTSSDSVVWDVDVQAAGEYEVFMEWSVDDKEAGKEYVLRSTGNELSGKVGKSGSWETYKSEKLGDLKLESGHQNIVFKSKKAFSKDGALLDLRNLKLVKK